MRLLSGVQGWALSAGAGLCGLGLSIAAVAAEGPAAAPTTAPTTQAAKPVNKFCPINADTEVDPKVTIVYEGKTIGFCCPDCIDDFKKDPQKYLKTMK